MPRYRIRKGRALELDGGPFLLAGVAGREEGDAPATATNTALVAAGLLEIVDPDAEPTPPGEASHPVNVLYATEPEEGSGLAYDPDEDAWRPADHALADHGHVIADVTALQAALDAKVDDTQVGAASGVAPLDSGSKVPVANLPTVERGVELGYAENTTGGSATTAAGTDIPGLTTTVTVTDRPIMVEFWCALVTTSSASADPAVVIKQDGTEVTRAVFNGSDNAEGQGIQAKRRLALAPGSYTFKATLVITAGSTATLFAATTFPAFLSVVEV